MSAQPSYNILAESTARFNVLDMITTIAGKAVPTYLFMDLDMSYSKALSNRYETSGRKISYTAILLKAISIAQRSHPASRSVVLPFGKKVIFNKIVAGFTVERIIGTQPAVFFGIIEDSDSKPLDQISHELQNYGHGDIAKMPYLAAQHWFNNMPGLFRQAVIYFGTRLPAMRQKHLGATFGLTSLGKLGIRSLLAPCATSSTFGIGEMEDQAVVRDGQVVIRPMMTITCTFDHRAFDGGPAARFLQEIKGLVEGGLEVYITDKVDLPDTVISQRK
jgi:pyruvate/2-oxoglutarate dehydrogenase complex dihydrolipoamide acyltransferase (E2) component